MKVDWSLGTEDSDYYVDSLSEAIPSGFYQLVGVKMFMRALPSGRLKDTGYLFRCDDYDRRLVSLYKRPAVR